MKMVCPFCGLGGTAAESMYGKKVRCPSCQKVFRVLDRVLVKDSSGVDSNGGAARAGGSKGPGAVTQAVNETHQAPRSGSAQDQYGNRAGAVFAARLQHDTNICSVCGFQLSEAFISTIGNRSVCAVCAK